MRQKDGGLRPMLRERLPAVHWTTVESGAIAPGTPDVEGCWKSRTFWIETKWTPGWAVTMRPEQVGWLLRRTRAGGRSWVLVRQTGSGREAARDRLWLVPGACAADLKARGIQPLAAQLRCWDGGPGGWDWAELLDLLAA